MNDPAVDRLINADGPLAAWLDPVERLVAHTLDHAMAIPVDLTAEPERAVEWMNAVHAIRVVSALRAGGHL